MPDAFWDPMHIMNPPFQACETSDFAAATDGQIHDPNNANPLMYGEWVDVTSNKLARAASTSKNAYLYVGEKGRTDLQMTKKGPILLTRPQRIRTKLVDATGSLGLNSEVMIADVTINSLTKFFFKKAATTGNYIQGKVTKAGTNSGAPDGSYWEILLYPQPLIIP